MSIIEALRVAREINNCDHRPTVPMDNPLALVADLGAAGRVRTVFCLCRLCGVMLMALQVDAQPITCADWISLTRLLRAARAAPRDR